MHFSFPRDATSDFLCPPAFIIIFGISVESLYIDLIINEIQFNDLNNMLIYCEDLTQISVSWQSIEIKKLQFSWKYLFYTLVISTIFNN